MKFDQEIVTTIQNLSKSTSSKSPFGWFVMGFFYAHPNNTKTLEQIFKNVTSILQVANAEDLSEDEVNNILFNMANNLINKSNVSGYKREEEDFCLSWIAWLLIQKVLYF